LIRLPKQCSSTLNDKCTIDIAHTKIPIVSKTVSIL